MEIRRFYMPNNSFTQDFDPSQHMGFETFKDKEKEMKKRELPELSKGENRFVKILSSSFCLFALVSMVSLLVVILIGNGQETNNFTGDGGYGFLGLASMVLFYLSLAFFAVVEMLYHTKWVEKENSRKSLVLLGFYLSLFFLACGYATIWMRPNAMYRAGYFSGLGILLFCFAFVVVGLGLYLNFARGKSNPGLVKGYNLAVVLLVFWVPVCNFPVLNNDIFAIPQAMWPVIVSAISSFISFFFFLYQKRNAGFRTAGEFFLFASFFLQATGVFYYAMIEAPQILSI